MIAHFFKRGIIKSRNIPTQNIAISHISKPTFSVTNSKRPFKTSCAKEPRPGFKLLEIRQIGGAGLGLDVTDLAGSNVSVDDLEFELSSRRISFNLTWLRDSCHCSTCTHKHSRQRLFTAKNFRKEKFVIDDVGIVDSGSESYHQPKLANVLSEKFLFVRWSDGHESRYSLDWLNSIDGLYRSTNMALASRQRPIFELPRDDLYAAYKVNDFDVDYWTVKQINENLGPVDYNDLIDGFEFHEDDPTFINANNIELMSNKRYNALRELTSHLTRFGLAKIVNVPTERNHVLRVARSMAYERPTGYGTIFDVVVEPSEEINLAYTTEEFDLHSDLTYRETSPGVQLLHCIRNSDEGGSSYFSDAFNAARILKQQYPMLFEVLLQFPAVFVVRDPYRNIKFRRQKTIMTLDHQGNLAEVYYSPFMLPPVGFKDDVKMFYLALDKFTQLLQSEDNKLITKMNPGDLFIFHNRRVLHGRSSYKSTSSDRFLQGCYMDWDEICCMYEKLLSNKH